MNIPPKPNVCEACDGKPYLFKNGMWLCQKCVIGENNITMSTIPSNSTPAQFSEGIAPRPIDTNIQVITDIYNAEVTAIAELKASIDSDETIENKQFDFATKLQARINNYKQVIWQHNTEVLQLANQQRANQTYLNDLANKLRKEEREKLKLQDLSYKPVEIKPAKVKSGPKPPKINFEKAEVKAELKKITEELSLEIGKPIPEYIVMMTCVSKGIMPTEAGNILRKMMKEEMSANS